MADENKNTNGTVIKTEFVDYSQYTPGNIDPTKDLPNLESGETLSKSLGKTKRWIEIFQESGGGGGGGATKYLHRIYLYRKGYYYIGFDLFTTSETSFQGDTQEMFNALAAEFTAQNFTNYSWRSIPHATGWYRTSSDGTAITIGAIYYDGTDFVGIREGVSLTTFADATIKLTNMKSFSTSPKGTIFDNNIIAIG